VNDDEARAMLEGGPAPRGHVQDIYEGSGPFAFGAPEWSGLAKLSEELGELQTVIGKLMATGGSREHWQGDLVPRLEEELADVVGAASHVMAYCPHLGVQRIEARTDVKIGLFEKWHDEGKDNRERGYACP
jgi:NTP pyrophosphatase (non-canonical NTP hydrolase)